MNSVKENSFFKKKLINKAYEISGEFAKIVTVFIDGLEAQEKINKEEQQEKPINKK